VIVVLVTSVSLLVIVVPLTLRIVGWETTERAVNEGIGPRTDVRLPGCTFGSSYSSVVRDMYCSTCPNALTDGEMGPGRRLELSDPDDAVATREWAEFADGREELDPERLKTRPEDAGAEPEDERAE
jgi:hypothetical protein